MFGFKDISVNFLTGSPWAVSLATIVLLGLAVLLYYRTNPPIPRYLSILLATVRILAVLVLVAALFEPVFSYSREFTRDKRIAVVLDRSGSMDRIENGLSRSVRLDSLLSGEDFERIALNADVSTYYFGENLVRGLSRVGTEKTALGEAVADLEKIELSRPSDHWLLFSDGNSNSGRKPSDVATGLKVPITTVGMASDVGEFDIGIAEVEFNPVAFVGQSTEIKVKLTWQSGAGKTAVVRLNESDKALADARYSIEEEGGFGEVTLKYVPVEPGKKLFQVNVPLLEGEASDGNNQRSIAVKVLKSRLEVLLVTAEPDYEVGFLRRFLLQSDRHDVDLIATGSKSGNLAGRLPSSQAALNRYDLVIFHDPDPRDLESRQALLRSYIAEKGGAIWIMMGARFAGAGPQDWLNDLLPFYQSRPTRAAYADFHGVPAEGELFHPAVRLADDRAGVRERWSLLPPFELLVPCDQIATGGTVLAFASGTGEGDARLPVLGYRRLGPGKLIASAALPFWTWEFETLGYEADGSDYERLLQGAISWLTVQDDFDPVRINPEQDVFSRGAPIRFEGFAFDQGFRPLPGVIGFVNLKNAATEETFEIDFVDRGEGKFTAEFRAVPPGEYDFDGIFRKEGRMLKKSSGRILIESFSLEESNQHGDPSTLQVLSRASGGKYCRYDEFREAVASMNLEPVTESVKAEKALWGRLWLLLLFVVLLTTEWLLRKVNHLI